MTSVWDELRRQRMQSLAHGERGRLDFPDLVELGVEGTRRVIEESNRSVAVAADVDWQDVEVEGPYGRIPVRVFRSRRGSAGPRPIVVHIHSGGFVAGGGLDQWNGHDSTLAAEADAIVVHPDFRLPPEHPFPVGLEENWAVLRWVAAGGVGQQSDPARIAVGGGCTGGNIAAVLSLMARDAGGPGLALQFLEGWPADLRADTRSQHEFATGYGLRKSDNDFVVSQYLSDPEERWDWRASPLLVSSVRGVAPAYVSVGEWDILRDEDVQYADRLRDAGIPVDLHVDPRRGHGPGDDPGLPRRRLVARLREAFAVGST
ncbi:MAG: alpha/beta hydrolase [Microbacterium sp.]|uniref:alpha/beta hydrolase n=1 Tax=Microbacterium sp. TaxID=51671 RepID=UPI0039E6ECDF